MTTTARIEVVGVKDTINQLNKLDKELAKEFKASATSIAQPAINAAKNMYTKCHCQACRVIGNHKANTTAKIKGFDVCALRQVCK
jgi:hypothetical protein